MVNSSGCPGAQPRHRYRRHRNREVQEAVVHDVEEHLVRAGFADQIADVRAPLRDGPRHGGDDQTLRQAGPDLIEILPGGADLGVRRLDPRSGGLRLAPGIIQGLLGRQAGLLELFHPLELPPGAVVRSPGLEQRGLRRFPGGLGPFGQGFLLPGVDLRQGGSLLDMDPFGDVDLPDETRHLGFDIHFELRGQGAGHVDPGRQASGDGQGRLHGNRRAESIGRGGPGSLPAGRTAAGQQECEESDYGVQGPIHPFISFPLSSDRPSKIRSRSLPRVSRSIREV